MQHIRVTGTVYRPLADPSELVALAIATRVDDPNPIVARIVQRVRALVEGTSTAGPQPSAASTVATSSRAR